VAGHWTTEVALGQYEPAGHTVQFVAPLSSWYDPVEHAPHTVCPAAAVKVPAEHWTHPVELDVFV
jgi:hypothetical protein